MTTKSKAKKPAKKPARTAKSRSSRAAGATSATKPSAPVTSSATRTALDPSTSTAKADSLSAAEERFAKLVALGMSQAEAYRRATGTKAKDETIYVQASVWARKVAIRIGELRAAAKARSAAQYVYEYEDAMRECDDALEVARDDGDSSAMSKAIALKAKLSGLETDPRKNEREPFGEMSDEELVEGINQNLDRAGFRLQ